MNSDERTTRLRQLGYSETEAAFILLTALHSGCFVTRQYSEFADVKPGAVTDQFTRKAAMRRHIKSYPTRNRTLVYQLCKPVFVAIGEPDNRNRRMKQADLTRLRLMGLDFVLRHPSHRYLATEKEKVDYFTALTGSRVPFPARVYTCNLTQKQTTRFFVEKYPIFESPSGTGLAFIDEDSLPAFESFLDRYMGLLSTIPKPELIFVTTNPATIPRAQLTFSNKTSGHDGQIDFTPFELHFREREQLESRSIADLDRDNLLKLRALQRSRFAPHFETWKAGGLTALQQKLGPAIAGASSTKAHFSACVLTAGYEFL